jgi:dihydropteroate synthase
MGRVAARHNVPLILMHMKGTPENMQEDPQYRDLIGDISQFLKDAIDRSVAAGIREDLILVDPGIGFGKTFDHNLQIIKELSRFRALGRPILVGTSNKAFIGHILDKRVDERETGSMATVAAGVMNGAHMVRVHNVKKSVETVRMIDAIRRGKA